MRRALAPYRGGDLLQSAPIVEPPEKTLAPPHRKGPGGSRIESGLGPIALAALAGAIAVVGVGAAVALAWPSHHGEGPEVPAVSTAAIASAPPSKAASDAPSAGATQLERAVSVAAAIRAPTTTNDVRWADFERLEASVMAAHRAYDEVVRFDVDVIPCALLGKGRAYRDATAALVALLRAYDPRDERERHDLTLRVDRYHAETERALGGAMRGPAEAVDPLSGVLCATEAMTTLQQVDAEWGLAETVARARLRAPSDGR